MRGYGRTASKLQPRSGTARDGCIRRNASGLANIESRPRRRAFRVRSGWNKCDHSRPGERRLPRFREPQADCFSIGRVKPACSGPRLHKTVFALGIKPLAFGVSGVAQTSTVKLNSRSSLSYNHCGVAHRSVWLTGAASLRYG